MSNKNILSSMAGGCCPRCRKGPLFTHKAYNLKKFGSVHEHCPNCGQRFNLEPSFFYGAMYVSYAIQVALFVTVYVATKLFYPSAGLWWYFGWVVGIIVLLLPVLYRLSRSIWIHIFVKYNRHLSKANL